MNKKTSDTNAFLLLSELNHMPELKESDYMLYVEQLSKLQSNELSIHEELETLELVSWPDKLALERTEQNALRSELSDLKENLTQIQQKLDQNMTKESKLTKDIREETERLKQKQAELKTLRDNEIKSKTDELEGLNVKSKELETSLSSVVEESQKCDTGIVERKLQLADLEKDLKAFNFENFSKVPSLLAVEGENFFNSNYVNVNIILSSVLYRKFKTKLC